MHPSPRLLAVVSSALSLSTAALAQTPGLVDRAAVRPERPPVSAPPPPAAPGGAIPSEALPSPGDDDLGSQFLLKRTERARLFFLGGNLGAFWTDNAQRLDEGGDEDFYYSASLGFGAQLPIAQGWMIDASVIEEFYRYDDHDELDFESTEATVGVIKSLPWLENFLVAGRYLYRRYTDGDWSEDTYYRHGLSLALQKTFLIDRKNSVYAALTGDWELEADPSLLRRHEYSLQTGYDFRLTHEVTLSAFYRFAYRDYTDGPLDEFNHIAGLAATWQVAEWARLELSGVWTFNDSDSDLLDYQAGSLGCGLNLRATF